MDVTRPLTPSIPDLREAFTGRVIAPDDPGYDEARTVFYGGFDRRPAAIVRAVATARRVTVSWPAAWCWI
jgi:hypothetical protein